MKLICEHFKENKDPKKSRLFGICTKYNRNINYIDFKLDLLYCNIKNCDYTILNQVADSYNPKNEIGKCTKGKLGVKLVGKKVHRKFVPNTGSHIRPLKQTMLDAIYSYYPSNIIKLKEAVKFVDGLNYSIPHSLSPRQISRLFLRDSRFEHIGNALWRKKDVVSDG